MHLNRADYRKQLLGCWIGKNIGGTLGMPFEWRRQINNVSFYTQDLRGEPLPNDDLDIQLLWLIALEEQGIDLDAHMLAEYWLIYVTPHWAEYGTAKCNLRAGLAPPLSGTYNNIYKHSCGAYIRSEIWACICPGNPRLAAKYAFEDGILDHGDGEGTYGAVFCAALEAAAFVCTDIDTLVDIGLSYIPADCGIAGAIANVRQSHSRGLTWREARDELLTHFRGSCMSGDPRNASAEDIAKGFHEGQLGWDAPSNVALVVLGLLYGAGNFDESMCVTVNCGEDTDCTAATVGSIFGIMHGVDAIDEKWIKPIGRSIKTACLNLGELGFFGDMIPADVDNLTDRTERITEQVMLRHRPEIGLDKSPADLKGLDVAALKATERDLADLYAGLRGPRYRCGLFDVVVDYGEGGPTVRDNTPKTIRLTILSKYRTQADMDVRWRLPEGWQVSPASQAKAFVPPKFWLPAPPPTLSFTLQTEKAPDLLNRFVVEINPTGRASTMLVPITLVSDNFAT